jgi:U3 small nucleolar RNA-associated protein 22
LKFDLSYEFLHQSDLSPVLLIKFNIKSSVRFYIRLFPTINHDTFKLARFSPSKHNIRLYSQEEQETGPATPYYNTSLARDTLLIPHATFLHQFTSSSPDFATAVQLGKIWLQQRSIGKGGLIGKGFNGFVFAMILAHLLRPSSAGGVLSRGFSSFQLFRGTVDYLAQLDISKDPIVIGRSQDQVNFSLENFTSVFPVVILDPTGTINLVPHLSLSDWKLIQSEFKHTSNLLSDKKVDHFSNIFLTDLAKNPLSRFDHVVKLNNLTLPQERVSPSEAIEFVSSSFLLQTKLVPELLKQGLTDRIDHIVSYFSDPAPSSISQPISLDNSQDHFIGLILNSQNSTRLTDRGPSPQETELAEEFRNLWGDKAELRRFQDGAIVESVVWKADHMKERREIVPNMIKYLAKRHFKATHHSIVYWGNQLTKFIDLNQKSHRGKREHRLSTKGFQPFVDQMDGLIKVMKKLTTVPLDIVSSTGLSAAYKNTSVFYPTPSNLSELAQMPETCRFVQGHDVNFELELSSDWPDDLVAIQRLKSAFYISIASELNEMGGSYNCKVIHQHINRDLPEISVSSYLAVWTSTGYLFRCYIYHPKELELLQAGAKDSKLSRLELEQFDKALKLYKSRFVYQPFLSARIHSLCLKHTSLSTLIRIAKRWIASHYLSEYINDEIVELLCSYIFVHQGSLSDPHSATTAFYRFLHLVSQFDFKANPLIIDFDQDMSIKFRQDSEDKFNSKYIQGTHQHPGICIITKIDEEGTCYLTQPIPKPIIFRLKKLAQAGLNCLKSISDQIETKNCDKLVEVNLIINFLIRSY